MARDFAKQFYKSKEWQTVRDLCLKRDAYLCQACHRAPAQEVHHIVHLTPQNINDASISLNPSNLICLCKDCHFEAHRGEHGTGRKHEEEYEYEFDDNGMLVRKKSADNEQ